MIQIRKKDVLEYHSRWRTGKIEVIASKPCLTQYDLSLAYSPGVAEPCREIHKSPQDVYKYTTKGNLVAVISNGTAVLGLGDIGTLAGKPVMEGKGVLFKRFADIDVFDIEVDSKDPDEVVRVVQCIAPTFGGINLEDIKAPECFYIEKRLKELLDIPVFHDDQHGTAIISGAALLNACEVAGKNLGGTKVLFCGAGASSIACAKLYISLGVRPENILMTDTKGVLYKGRKDGMNPYKDEFARETPHRTLAEAIKGMDVFVGLSVAGMLTKEMVATMADRPIIFAMANPDPEITYEDAKSVRDDLIMATGRSDYPNQVNNVLGFPFIFRGALDVRASAINEDMKIAAVHALAELAKEDVPDQVSEAYEGQRFRFGPEYIIPKPFDHRVLLWVAPAVARAAMESGVARQPIADFDAYREQLEKLINPSSVVMRKVINQAKTNPKKIVFPEGEQPKVLRACQRLVDEGIAHPVLLGREERIKKVMKQEEIELENVEIIDPYYSKHYGEFVNEFQKKRARRGVTKSVARLEMQSPINFGLMMVSKGLADGFVSGLTMGYAESMRPALRLIGTAGGIKRACGVYLVILKNDMKFFADTTVNIDPNAEELLEIALTTARFVASFGITPKIAMLSFANFGSSPCPQTEKVKQATAMIKAEHPDIVVDGEIQVDLAVDPDLVEEVYPFCAIKGDANVFIFPDLSSGNIGYKLMGRLGGATVIGPILLGMAKPINILQHGADVESIINLTAFTVVRAQNP